MKKYSILMFYLAIVTGISAQNIPAKFRCGESITDERDGKTYKTVLIGEQCWMAENLNTGVIVSDMMQQDNGIIEKTCYDNNAENCRVYGGLYTWNEAMNWSIEEGNQGICPAGWHIPAKNEWDELRNFLGQEEAGQQLKATRENTPLWDGTNSSGFTALPAGVGYESYFGRINKWALFWSSTQADEDYAWFTQLDNHWYPAPPKYKILYLGDHFVKENGFSVRCILDR